MKKKKKKINISLLSILGILGIIILAVVLLKNSNNNQSKLKYSDDVTIRYAYEMGVPTAESMNKEEDYIDIVKIEPNKNELKKLKEILNEFEFTLDKAKESTGVAGIYELTIGNQMVLLDQEEGLYTTDSKSYYKINISTALFDFVSDIVFENVEPKHEVIKTNEIYMENVEIGNTTFTNKKQIEELLNSIRYTKLKRQGNDVGTDMEYFIDFKNGITITIYRNSNTALYNNNGKEEFILLYQNPKEILKNILSIKIQEDEAEILKTNQ